MSEHETTQTRTVEANGARLPYEIAGSGFPLVLVHAGVADRRMWDDQVAAFAGRYRTIRYDLRSFGESVGAPGPFSHHADLRALLDGLEIERAHLVDNRTQSFQISFVLGADDLREEVLDHLQRGKARGYQMIVAE